MPISFVSSGVSATSGLWEEKPMCRTVPFFYRVFHVLFLIHAVQKAHVHIIGAQPNQFPVEGLLNFRQVPAPAVFALFVICRAEMQSEKHLVLG